jgi:predicted nuclease of predicted toxin-antitoxin system
MRFVADAGVEWQIVRPLREQHGQENVYWMKEEALKQKADLQLNNEPSIPDSVVRQRAIEQNALLITQDKSFARNMEVNHSCPPQGVALIDLAGNGKEKANKAVPFLREHQNDMQGQKTYIGEKQQVIGSMSQENVFPPTKAEKRANAQAQQNETTHNR